MKNRMDLLDCAKILTKNNVGSKRLEISHLDQNEISIQEMISDEVGWEYFQSVFMVSALTGDGVGDIQVIILSVLL